MNTREFWRTIAICIYWSCCIPSMVQTSKIRRVKNGWRSSSTFLRFSSFALSMIWRLSSIGPQVSCLLYSHSSKVQVSLLQYRYLATLLRRAQVLPLEKLEQGVDWGLTSLRVAESQQKSEANSAIYRIKGTKQPKCGWSWCFPLHLPITPRQMHWRGTKFSTQIVLSSDHQLRQNLLELLDHKLIIDRTD